MGLAAVGLEQEVVGDVHGVDAPAVVAAGHDEGVVAALGGVLLVGGELLAGLQEPVVVEVELGAAGVGGVGQLVLGVPGGVDEGLVGLDVAGLGDGHGGHAPVDEAHEAVLSQGLERGAGGQGAGLDGVLDHLLELAAHGHFVVEAAEVADNLAVVLVGVDAAGLGALVDLLGQEVGYLPLGLGLTLGLGGAL